MTAALLDVVGDDADGPHLSCLGVDAYVQLAPLMPMLGRSPFVHLDCVARGIAC